MSVIRLRIYSVNVVIILYLPVKPSNYTFLLDPLIML